jgi:hypothetical protein
VANPFGNEALRVLEGGAVTDRISTGQVTTVSTFRATRSETNTAVP